MPAWQLSGLLRRREISPVELLDHLLGRIDELEPSLHAFITVAAESARREAQQAEAALSNGEPVGPLCGIPIALKDELWTKGLRSTGGSLIYGDFVPTREGVAM